MSATSHRKDNPFAWSKKEWDKERITIWNRERLVVIVNRYDDNPKEGEAIARMVLAAPKMAQIFEDVVSYLTDCKHDVSEGGFEQRNCPKCILLKERADILSKMKGE